MKKWKTIIAPIMAVPLLIYTGVQGQPRVKDTALLQSLKGQTKLEAIMDIVLDYYKDSKPIEMNESGPVAVKGNPINKWVRWAYQNSSRLDEKGNLTDFPARNF